MLPITFLALTDSKTITLPQPWEDDSGRVSLTDLSDLEAIGIIALVFLGLYVLVLLWSIASGKAGRRSARRPEASAPRTIRKAPRTPMPPRGKVPARPRILIDGSNVMHWQDNQPGLAPLLTVIKDLTGKGYAPNVVFDANAGWKLFDKYLSDHDFARMLGLRADQVLVVPKGTQADPFLLETADAYNVRIVTNDRFRDWAETYPKVRERGFLVRGEWAEGSVRLEGLEATGKAQAGMQS